MQMYFFPFCFQGKRLQASTCTIYHNNFCLENQNQNNNNNNQNAPSGPLNSCRRQTSGQTDVAFVFFFLLVPLTLEEMFPLSAPAVGVKS